MNKLIRFILWVADGIDYKDSIRLSFFLLTCVSATATTNGLVGWYKFDTGSGSVATDSSTNLIDGVLVNSPTWVTGKVGSNALLFDGVNEHVKATNTVTTYPVTLSAWVKLSSTTFAEDSYQMICSQSELASLRVVQLMFSQNTNLGGFTLRMHIEDSGGYAFAYSAITVDTNWHHITAIWTTVTNRTLYWDGASMSLTSGAAGTTPSLTGMDTLFAGILGINTSTFLAPLNGRLDDVRLYNRALNACEVTELYLMGSPNVGFTVTGARAITTDGSFSATQAAIDFVECLDQEDWVVTFGTNNGSYTWNTMLDISVGARRFTLQGASSNNPPSLSVTATTGFGIYLGCSDGKLITLKDFKATHWDTTSGLILVGGGGEDGFRITNIEFTGDYGDAHCIWVSAANATDTRIGPYGLIDHCSAPNGVTFIFVRDNPLASPNSWHRPMSWGTKKAVYIEDCVFNAPYPLPAVWNITDGDNGGRIVLRYSIITNYLVGTHGPDSQPLEGGQNPNKSILQMEVYKNNFVTTSNGTDSLVLIRGGSFTKFSNTVSRVGGTATFNTLIKVPFYRSVPGNGVCPVDRFINLPNTNHYVGTQQPGCGVVAEAGEDPLNPSEPWGSVPIYVWGNDNSVPLIYDTWGYDGVFMQIDRDLFEGTARPGYTAYTYPHPLQASSGSVPANNIQINGAVQFSGSVTIQ